MKIAIGCDHGGYLLKQDILIWLEEHDIDFEDVGCYNTDSVDYPVYGEKVARLVSQAAELPAISAASRSVSVTSEASNPIPISMTRSPGTSYP